MEYTSKETIVYGGAFNPPTRAHQVILQGCVDYAEPRQADVWLLPSANRRDKTIDTPRERRLELCSALFKDVVSRTVAVSVVTTELDRAAETETYKTVHQFTAEYPDRTFKWVFGSDSLAAMPGWNQGKWLLANLPMLLVERDGAGCALLGKNAALLGVKTEGISSTEVRRRMADGEDYSELVSARVEALLKWE